MAYAPGWALEIKHRAVRRTLWSLAALGGALAMMRDTQGWRFRTSQPSSFPQRLGKDVKIGFCDIIGKGATFAPIVALKFGDGIAHRHHDLP